MNLKNHFRCIQPKAKSSEKMIQANIRQEWSRKLEKKIFGMKNRGITHSNNRNLNYLEKLVNELKPGQLGIF